LIKGADDIKKYLPGMAFRKRCCRSESVGWGLAAVSCHYGNTIEKFILRINQTQEYAVGGRVDREEYLARGTGVGHIHPVDAEMDVGSEFMGRVDG
jgi:hypothetical protein